MKDLSWERLRSIRKELEQAWDVDTAYETYEGERGSSNGQCYVSALVAYLILEEYNPVLVNGDVGRGDNDHWWLEIDGKIVDLTADQFKELRLPPIIWGTYEENPIYKPYRQVSSFKRFLILLRRLDLENLLLNPVGENA